MKIKEKRVSGEILGRGGISQRIIQLATEISTGTYKEAIEKAGRISVLVQASTFDEYWDEKANIGKRKEEGVFFNLNNVFVNKDKVITRNEIGR